MLTLSGVCYSPEQKIVVIHKPVDLTHEWEKKTFLSVLYFFPPPLSTPLYLPSSLSQDNLQHYARYHALTMWCLKVERGHIFNALLKCQMLFMEYAGRLSYSRCWKLLNVKCFAFKLWSKIKYSHISKL